MAPSTLGLFIFGACGWAQDTGGTGGVGLVAGVNIVVAQLSPPPPASAPTYNVDAQLLSAEQVGALRAQCHQRIEGSCTLSTCSPGPIDAGAPLRAGAITVSSPETTVTLTPGADGTYASATKYAPFWKTSGETITARASGAEVPAFTSTVQAPAMVAITSPTLPGLDSLLSVPRSKDLAVAWSGPGGGTVDVYLLHGYSPPSTSFSIDCQLDAAAGQAVVPASLLGQLPPGMGIFLVTVTNTSTTSTGAYPVSFQGVIGVSAPAAFE